MAFGILGFYTFKTYAIIRWLFPNYLWRKESLLPKTIYLTFDDGPTPHITDKVLLLLSQYQAKATFFLIGKNAVEHPEITQRILNEGHRIGNHTQNHLKGSQTDTQTYIKNVLEAEKNLPFTHLFRPPYGRITKHQAYALLQKGYKIVMWDVLSGDFDPTLSVEKSEQKLKKYTQSGSIVVFHDSVKAQQNLLYILPRVLAYWQAKGYRFEKL